MNLPNVDGRTLLANAEILDQISRTLIEDDATDIGYFEYYGRKDHYYHGVHSPDHPSPFHHWWIGGLTLAAAKLMGIAAVGKIMMEEDNEQAKPVFDKII